MSWLVTLILMSSMFASEGGIAVSANYENARTPIIVKFDETENFEQTYPLSANGRISVSNVNGSVTIEAWDRSEVKLNAVKTAETKENLQDVQIKIDARQDSLRVEADYESNWKRGESGTWKNKNYNKLEVQFHLFVPRGAILDEIETVNGSVQISNMTNVTKASTVNGNVQAKNLRGAANLNTVNGTINADFDTIQADSRISLSTVNGTVNLLVPSDVNATLRADTVNGSITNDFGLPVRKGEYVGRDMYGKVGSGEVKIKLSSVNGGLSIKRKSDGRNPNPAINLLPQKGKVADEDEDFDSDDEAANVKVKVKADIAKANREAQAATREAQAAAREAAENTRRELPKIPTELLKEQIKQQVRDAMEKQKEALKNLPNVNWEWNGAAPLIDNKSESFNVKGTPKVTVDAKNCVVTVRGWDKSEVKYSVVRISRFPRRAANVDSPVSVENTESEVNIKVAEDAQPDGAIFNDGLPTRIEVFVPKKSNLRIVTEREIRLENVSGDIDLQGGEESVNVRDVDGKLSVGTADGGIRVIGFSGRLDAKTEDGTMNLEGDFQTLNALASDGTIILTLPASADAMIDSNTEIENQGLNLTRDDVAKKQWRIGKGSAIYRFSVDDGKVIVRNSSSLQ